MSKEEIGEAIGEQESATRANTMTGFVLSLVVKYGLPSVCCIWLFYVIWCKDQILYSQTKEITQALIENNKARENEASAIRDLAEAVRNIK